MIFCHEVVHCACRVCRSGRTASDDLTAARHRQPANLVGFRAARPGRAAREEATASGPLTVAGRIRNTGPRRPIAWGMLDPWAYGSLTRSRASTGLRPRRIWPRTISTTAGHQKHYGVRSRALNMWRWRGTDRGSSVWPASCPMVSAMPTWWTYGRCPRTVDAASPRRWCECWPTVFPASTSVSRQTVLSGSTHRSGSDFNLPSCPWLLVSG